MEFNAKSNDKSLPKKDYIAEEQARVDREKRVREYADAFKIALKELGILKRFDDQ